MENNTCLSDVEASRYLGLGVQTLRNYRHCCKGPVYHRLGRRIIYRIADLESYLAERRINPEAQATP
jgi:hypothetical protein